MTKENEIRQEMYQIAKKAAAILERSQGNLAGAEAAMYDDRMIDFDVLAKSINYSRNGRDAKEILRDMEKPLNKPIIEDIGTGDNGELRGTVLRGPDGTEVRAFTPDERLNYVPDPNLRLDKVIQGALMKSYRGLSEEERTASVGLITSGGWTVPTNLANGILQSARDQFSWGRTCMTVEMPQANLKLVGVSGEPTASWTPENSAFTESAATFFAVPMQGKKVGTYTSVSVELAHDGVGLVNQLENSLGYAIGRAVEQGVYEGNGAAGQPLGIKNTPGINSTAGGAAVITVENLVANGYWTIRRYNGLGRIFLVAPAKWHAWLDTVKLAAAAPYAMTYAGGAPASMAQIERLISNALTYDSTADTVDIYQLAQGAVAVGVVPDEALVLEIFRGSDSALTQGKVYIRAYARYDVGVLYPSWCHAYTSVKCS